MKIAKTDQGRLLSDFTRGITVQPASSFLRLDRLIHEESVGLPSGSRTTVNIELPQVLVPRLSSESIGPVRSLRLLFLVVREDYCGVL